MNRPNLDGAGQREPDKCRSVCWFPLNDLPERIIAYPAAGIDAYRHGSRFNISGWSAPAQPGRLAHRKPDAGAAAACRSTRTSLPQGRMPP